MDEIKKVAPKMVVEEVETSESVPEKAEASPEVRLEAKPEKVEPKREIYEIKRRVEKTNIDNFNIMWVLIPGILLLGLLLGGVFAYYRGLNGINKPSPKSSPTPAASAIPSNPTPTPQAKKIDLTKYAITLLNGSGVAGEASKVKTLLETAGFKVSSTGNAKTYDFEKTEISVKSGIEADFVKSLVSTLSKSYQLADPVTSATQSASVVITIGSLKAK